MDVLNEFCNENGGDNRLKNWGKWLKTHKKQYIHLKSKVNRNSASLLMNRFINEQRYINQEKTFIDKAKTYIKGDYYRGHPNFWKFPISLKCYKTLPPCYIAGQEYDRTKPDPPPPFPEYICTPDQILIDQGIENVGDTGIRKWETSSLINKQLSKIQRNNKTTIHRPYYKDFIILPEQFPEECHTPINDSVEYLKKRFENIYSLKNNKEYVPEISSLVNEIKTKNVTEIEDNLIYIKLTIEQPIIENPSMKHIIPFVINNEEVQEKLTDSKEKFSEIIIKKKVKDDKNDETNLKDIKMENDQRKNSRNKRKNEIRMENCHAQNSKDKRKNLSKSNKLYMNENKETQVNLPDTSFSNIIYEIDSFYTHNIQYIKPFLRTEETFKSKISLEPVSIEKTNSFIECKTKPPSNLETLTKSVASLTNKSNKNTNILSTPKAKVTQINSTDFSNTEKNKDDCKKKTSISSFNSKTQDNFCENYHTKNPKDNKNNLSKLNKLPMNENEETNLSDTSFTNIINEIDSFYTHNIKYEPFLKTEKSLMSKLSPESVSIEKTNSILECVNKTPSNLESLTKLVASPRNKSNQYNNVLSTPNMKDKVTQINSTDFLNTEKNKDECKKTTSLSSSNSKNKAQQTNKEILIQTNFKNQAEQVNITVSGTLISDQDNQSIANIFNFNMYDKETQVKFECEKSISVSKNDDEKSTEVKNEITNEKSQSDRIKIDNNLSNFEITLMYSDCKVNCRYQKIIKLVNDSSVCIRYDWRMLPNTENKRIPLKESRFVHRFFFNRNSGVILPGGSTSIEINFKSKQPGVFMEMWEFITDPPTKYKYYLINLEAIVLDETNESSWKCFKKYVEYSVMNSFARSKVNDLLMKVGQELPLKDLLYSDQLLEEDIFLHNNPDLFYESNSVHILKDLNYKLTLDTWDYSVQNLREKILKTESSDKEQYLDIFSKNVKNLIKPKGKSFLYDKKYKTVYEILCSLVNKIEDEGINLKKCFDIVELTPIKLSSNVLDLKHSEIENKHKNRKTKKSLLKISPKSTESLQSVLESFEKPNVEKHDFKMEKYIQVLYIKTYEHLSRSIDEISATMESISVLQKKSMFSSLGK